MPALEEVTIYGSNKWSKLEPIKLSKIETVNFPADRYYPSVSTKDQIVLHHTVSGPGVRGDINTWISDSRRIATHIIIGRDGTPYQCYSSRYWAHHLGITKKYLRENGYADYRWRNGKLNRQSIGVELDSWGWLEKVGDKEYKTYYKNTVHLEDEEVIYYKDGYKGKNYYEAYTEEQLKTAGELILYWKDLYDIDISYKGDKMFSVCREALKGEPGVWTHTSYREDKSDCHPDPNLISMLKTIS